MWTVAKMTQVAKHPEGAEGPHFFKNVSNSEKGYRVCSRSRNKEKAIEVEPETI